MTTKPGDAGRRNKCKRLLIKDLLKIFENYEPSKFLIWEIVRTLHPAHTAALLFILENIARSYKTDTLTTVTDRRDEKPNDLNASGRIENESNTTLIGNVRLTEIDENTTVAEHGIVLCSIKPTLCLKPCEYDYRILPDINDSNDVTASHDKLGNLTVFGLIKIMQSARDYETCNVHERIVMHNLRTKQYTQFSQNVLYLLFPEHMQQSRYSAPSTILINGNGNENGMHVKYMQYYESFYTSTATATHDSRTFRYANRPRAARVYGKSSISSGTDKLYVQPRYAGYNIVVNATNHSTRTYNRHGELLQSVLYQKRFPQHATFEAVLMPADERGEPRSWRYVRHTENGGSNAPVNRTGIATCQNFILFVVDVFRIRNRLLIDEPFSKRIQYARLLKCENVRVADTRTGIKGVELWDAMERQHYINPVLDCFAPINGVFLRHDDDKPSARSRQYIFSSNVIYSFQKNITTRMLGDCSLRLALDSYFSPDMAERCTVVPVYAHDDQFYYTCAFDRDEFTFVHDVRLDRVCDVWRTKLRYKTNAIYVRDALIVPMGIALLRVYHNTNTNFRRIDRDSRRTIVSYETKITTSIHDVPYEPVSWF